MKSKHIPQAVREELYLKYGGHCAYCGCELKPSSMKVDRVGKEDLPCCGSCYSFKKGLSVEAFRMRISCIPERVRTEHPEFSIGERFGVVGRTSHDVVFYFEKEDADV